MSDTRTNLIQHQLQQSTSFAFCRRRIHCAACTRYTTRLPLIILTLYDHDGRIVLNMRYDLSRHEKNKALMSPDVHLEALP